MKKLFLFLLFLALGALVFYDIKNKNFFPQNPAPVPSQDILSDNAPAENSSGQNDQKPAATTPIKDSQTGFVAPLPNAASRVTKKPFGIYITSATSLVQPERFAGYHTGTDFEVFSDEIGKNITVDAVCSGKLILKEYASGYGGAAVQSCTFENQPITVVYGHLKLASIKASIGQILSIGDPLGILGTDKSAETDGERKHLHLSFHKGTGINILGYAGSQNALSSWIDPCQYVCQ